MILMIHGAGATSLSFNYISLWLDQEIQFLDYRVGETRDEIFQRIERPDEIQYIIGHSYGGLLASLWLGQTKRNYCKGLVTIASPWQGSPTARILNWFLSDPVWNDMKPGSDLLKEVNSLDLSLPIKNIVANPVQGGNGLAALGRSENDGTIPVNSARSTPTGFSKCHSVEIPHGHAEILQSWDTVEHIRKFLDNPQGHFVQQATRSEEHIRNSMAQIQLGYDPLMKRNR
tara:strand:- start:1761 stop:2450 length:690 start_codon:yes stop_codon:yes gene_type:complete